MIDVELARYPSIETVVRQLADAGLNVQPAVALSDTFEVDDPQPCREKSGSSLHLISEEAFRAGLGRMKTELDRGSIKGMQRYTVVIASKPPPGRT